MLIREGPLHLFVRCILMCSRASFAWEKVKSAATPLQPHQMHAHRQPRLILAMKFASLYCGTCLSHPNATSNLNVTCRLHHLLRKFLQRPTHLVEIFRDLQCRTNSNIVCVITFGSLSDMDSKVRHKEDLSISRPPRHRYPDPPQSLHWNETTQRPSPF